MNMWRRPMRKNKRFWSMRPSPKAERCSGLVTNASASSDTHSSTRSGEYFSTLIAMLVAQIILRVCLLADCFFNDFSETEDCAGTVAFECRTVHES